MGGLGKHFVDVGIMVRGWVAVQQMTSSAKSKNIERNCHNSAYQAHGDTSMLPLAKGWATAWCEHFVLTYTRHKMCGSSPSSLAP